MFYFHVRNGETVVDNDGIELADIDAARIEAVSFLGDLLRDGEIGDLWSNHPLRLWVTDKTDGETLFALNITAQI